MKNALIIIGAAVGVAVIAYLVANVSVNKAAAVAQPPVPLKSIAETLPNVDKTATTTQSTVVA